MKYDHKKIESKWQKEWEKKKLYTVKDEAKGKDNFYTLVEFPYPSGNLHVGHWYAFSVPDIFVRMKRMQGQNVLFPIGFDAFGLPAENAAIQRGINPGKWTYSNIAYMRGQLRTMGASFDWSREVVTCDSTYYKWTQWIFLQFFKKGLAYQAETNVNWCPKDKTVLANEQVVGGRCERCDSVVEQRKMKQWMLKITDYAEKLLAGLDKLDWPEEIKESQRNWIGKSEGAELEFPIVVPAKAGIQSGIKRFVLLHGKGGTPQGVFLPWLKKNLERRGYEVQVPAMPGGDAPNDLEQTKDVLKNCDLDEQTVLVGHSFGGVVAMRLLESGIIVNQVVLVATPFSGKFLDGKERPTVKAAVERGFDFAKIKKNTSSFLVLSDTNDYVVPVADGKELAKKLDADFKKVAANKSHFTGTKEPLILKNIISTSLLPPPLHLPLGQGEKKKGGEERGEGGVKVFTTRPDTIFGATYLVLTPEHPLIENCKLQIANYKQVGKYIEQAMRKTELERLEQGKEKTGVELKGIKAVNPATEEEIPIWIADYVLGSYGTGAIMAVPAHDERDWEFAKKFGLPIKVVIKHAKDYQDVSQQAHKALVKELFAFSKLKNFLLILVGGMANSIYRKPEVWLHSDVDMFTDKKGYGVLEEYLISRGYKKTDPGLDFPWQNMQSFYSTDGMWVDIFLLEKENDGYFDSVTGKIFFWGKKEIFLRKNFEGTGVVVPKLDLLQKIYLNQSGSVKRCFTDYGILSNSEKFTGMRSEEAIPKIAGELGRVAVQYKIRDWVISRQRYWGVPIPLVFCEDCSERIKNSLVPSFPKRGEGGEFSKGELENPGWIAVKDRDLPVELPEVKDYKPKGDGKSPLAKVEKWVKVKCPKCGNIAERETDTMDTFVDSSWYFLRYLDPKNKKKFADEAKMRKWMPVDMYSGGAEHTTMHVLYSRFWIKAMYDLGLLEWDEPYAKRLNRGLILGPDGQKMSKSRGNVVDPDNYIKELGADTVRMYLAFIGPYNVVGAYPWDPKGIMGVRRFLEKVWRLFSDVIARSEAPKQSRRNMETATHPSDARSDNNLDQLLHRIIKKVGDDIENFKFNTAISAMMVLLNKFSEMRLSIIDYQLEIFLKLLAPFAPHLAEELWHQLGHKKSIHLEPWPEYDKSLIKEEVVNIAVQVNGKLRTTVEAAPDASEDEIKEQALADENVKKHLAGKQIKKVIYVKGKILNFVV